MDYTPAVTAVIRRKSHKDEARKTCVKYFIAIEKFGRGEKRILCNIRRRDKHRFIVKTRFPGRGRFSSRARVFATTRFRQNQPIFQL